MRQFSSKQDICDWLNQFEHELLAPNWANISGVVTMTPSGAVSITLPFASVALQKELNAWVCREQSAGVPNLPYDIDVAVRALETPVNGEIAGVKNVIAVSSAKGGVGKSTTAVNLALALSAGGARVGLLDADIYGPSVPLMLGKLNQRPDVRDGQWMQPIEAYGIYTNSIGYLMNSDDAAIWRGPMAAKALTQLINETEWPNLDYLVIDMPPGTGDIQLTLSQQIPVTGSIIVTTPQDLALADARKGAAMFAKVDVPVLGIVENMSYHVCSQCGATEAIFGSGGAAEMAQEYHLALLAQLPLHIAVREDIDRGTPTVVARPDSDHAKAYYQLADQVASTLFWHGKPRAETILYTKVE
ncbi:iron-sulfur cluster carrier protein ApbC [Vibrio sp. SM6]|uniref:Iron-sulfur cluster carrier protein n=1 Tax=Vibrio agarilyticus TaxID=2726741 RepID=A0A7X8TRZ8_9VIBR|nr:iron-sulfur cluster carrier protein ApbC [Vibrio agarilyticus]NLS13887.1 iron-sulfur cluster carrier protein ApbC [Vibrio agarilyticus]